MGLYNQLPVNYTFTMSSSTTTLTSPWPGGWITVLTITYDSTYSGFYNAYYTFGESYYRNIEFEAEDLL